MNKKILSIFALIMAISILGVSCAKDNNTTAPTTTTPIISATEAKAVVNAITDDIGSTAFKFSTVTVSGDNDKYTVSLQDATTATEVNSDTFLAAIQAKATDMQNASTKITIAESDIKIAVDQENNKKATVTITYKSKDGKKSGTITMNLELTNAGSPSFTYPKLVLTPTKGTTTSAFAVDLAQALTIDLAEAISETGVTYTVTTVAGVNKTTITPNTTVDLSSGATVTETQKPANYHVEGTVITIDNAVKTELIGSKARAAGALGTAGATGGIKITLKASKTGYTDKTDLEIYVVLTGYEAE